jgi:hypothetical protein
VKEFRGGIEFIEDLKIATISGLVPGAASEVMEDGGDDEGEESDGEGNYFGSTSENGGVVASLKGSSFETDFINIFSKNGSDGKSDCFDGTN